MSTSEYDSGPATASARKYVLAIIGLAALALQIGWMDNARQERLTLFAYFDKTLTIHELIEAGLNDKEKPLKVAETSLGPDSAPIVILGSGEGNPMELVRLAMTGHTFAELSFAGQTDELMTLTDPGGSCTVRVFQGRGERFFLVDEYSSLNRFQRWSQTQRVSAAQTYSVLFGRNCVFQLESNEPVVIYRLADSWGVLLPLDLQRLGDFPGAFASPNASFDYGQFHANEFSEEDKQQFSGANHPVPRAYRISTLSAFVIQSATTTSGKTFAPGEWLPALGELLKSQAAAPTILGITLPPQLAVVFMPLAMLLLSITVFHRVRRIVQPNPEEHWILLHPQGPVEKTFATLWLAALILSPATVLWAGQIYDRDAFDALFSNVEALFTSLEIIDPYTTESLSRSENLENLLSNIASYTFVLSFITELLILAIAFSVVQLNGVLVANWPASVSAWITARYRAISGCLVTTLKKLEQRLSKPDDGQPPQ